MNDLETLDREALLTEVRKLLPIHTESTVRDAMVLIRGNEG